MRPARELLHDGDACRRSARDVTRNFGAKPLWLTEYGYQTNPPDRLLGVSYALQAQYIGEAALRVWQQPGVTMLIQFLVRDEPSRRRLAERPLQRRRRGEARPTTRSRCRSPGVAQRRAHGALGRRCVPAPGARAYVLQRAVGGAGARSAATRTHRRASGAFTRTVSLPARRAGSHLRAGRRLGEPALTIS